MILSASPTWKSARPLATSFRSTSTTRSSASGHWEPDHWAVDAVGAPHVGERTEKQLITAFCGKIAELSPRLVTFNGHSFDLPVLRYRAMVHGVSAPGLAARPYFNRYSDLECNQLDLCACISSSSPRTASIHIFNCRTSGAELAVAHLLRPAYKQSE
jgi:predicted PolB exonuclease-like 3'-5' exonuclease